MNDDDEPTPVDTPRARRTSSTAISLVDLIAADVGAWAEQVFAKVLSDARKSEPERCQCTLCRLAVVQLPELPPSLRERNAQRLAAIVRATAAVEREEIEKLRADLLISEARRRALETEIFVARNAMRRERMDVQRGRHDGKGTRWAPLLAGSKRTASLWCPNGHLGTLEDHNIATDGSVSPSVACPSKGCDFHEHVKLVGWVP